MGRINGFIIAGMLGLLTLPAMGAGRGNGAQQPGHAFSESTKGSHAATHSPKPPKTPSVGGAAPAPVAVHKQAAVSASAVGVGGGDEPPDNDPVQDNDPVLDLVPVSDYVSPPTISPPALPSFNDIESRRVGPSRGPHTGLDMTARPAAGPTAALWTRIDAASSRVQAALSDQPEYRAAVARLAAAEQTIAALRAGGEKNSAQIRLAARKALEANEEIAMMRMNALEADPNFRAALTRDEPAAVVPHL
jgi:hypothetical protein